VKKQTVKPSKLPAETRVPTNQHPPIKETLKRRTSSPAAPPPSSVIGLIEEPQPGCQQAIL
ncbi:hypothetical protein, partial [Ensifer sp. ENS11]|uniref:hypothetical protein n=1 Tax=Ensifer sp. ENS11 TaxID=2769291 RepID=UPI001AEF0352